MSIKSSTRLLERLFDLLPLLVFIIIVAFFSVLSPQFATIDNFRNILLQSSHLAILALGMALILLVGGVDLSVGAVMYATVVVVGLVLPGAPVWACLLAAICIGAAVGAINAFFIVTVRVAAFIVTLAMMFVARGAGLFASDTKMVFASDNMLDFMQASVFGLPVPILLAGSMLVVVHILLKHTPFGREVYAVGSDREGARRAGINVNRVLFVLFVLCAISAALAGALLMGQIAAAASTFGERKEFLAIAAAVLGGTSLFGGRGNAIGPVSGAVLIQTVENGLVMINADPYLYPLVTASVIFFAVLVDTLRNRVALRRGLRKIRVEDAAS